MLEGEFLNSCLFLYISKTFLKSSLKMFVLIFILSIQNFLIIGEVLLKLSNQI